MGLNVSVQKYEPKIIVSCKKCGDSGLVRCWSCAGAGTVKMWSTDKPCPTCASAGKQENPDRQSFPSQFLSFTKEEEAQNSKRGAGPNWEAGYMPCPVCRELLTEQRKAPQWKRYQVGGGYARVWARWGEPSARVSAVEACSHSLMQPPRL
eukprot:jgi/Mesvir1/25031/Mv16970-RA.1